MKNYLLSLPAGVALLVLASGASATAIDVTNLVSSVSAQAAPVGLVGVACLLVYGAVKAFGWVRGALK